MTAIGWFGLFVGAVGACVTATLLVQALAGIATDRTLDLPRKLLLLMTFTVAGTGVLSAMAGICVALRPSRDVTLERWRRVFFVASASAALGVALLYGLYWLG